MKTLKKLVLCGTQEAFLQTLQKSGGNIFPIEQSPDSPPAPSTSRRPCPAAMGSRLLQTLARISATATVRVERQRDGQSIGGDAVRTVG